MQVQACPNLNHGRTNPPVAYCPECSKMVNKNLITKKCSEGEHAKKRRNRSKYCFDCGEQLIR